MLTNDTDTKGRTMNILVIGGTRFFGIHTVKRLLESGHTVTAATRCASVCQVRYGEHKQDF